MAQFLVDEVSWREGVIRLPYVERIEQILDTIDYLLDRGHSCIYSDELFTCPLIGDRTFYDLYDLSAPTPIPAELQERVAAIFGRLRVWQDLDAPWPNSFDVSVDGRDVEYAPSVAWAHTRACEGADKAVPCIVHSERRPCGSVSVRVQESVAEVWMIASIEDAPAYFRWLISKTTNSPDEMARIARDAFPALDFVAEVFDGVKAMSKPYRAIVDDLILHLGFLPTTGGVFSRELGDSHLRSLVH